MDDFVPSMMSSGSNLQHCRRPHSQLGSFGRKCALHPSLKICFAKSKTPLWTHSYSAQLSFCQKAYEADEVLRTNIEKCTHHITTCAKLSYWHQQLQSQWIRRFLVNMGEVVRWAGGFDPVRLTSGFQTLPYLIHPDAIPQRSGADACSAAFARSILPCAAKLHKTRKLNKCWTMPAIQLRNR